MSNRLYTIQEVANILGVSTKTLRRWDQRGRFVPMRTAGNQRRYTQQQIDKFRNNQKSASKTASEIKPLFGNQVPQEPKAIHSLPSILSSLPSGSFLKRHFILEHEDNFNEFKKSNERKEELFDQKQMSKFGPVKMGLMFAGLVLIFSFAGTMIMTKYNLVAGLTTKKEQFAKFIADLPQISINIKPKDLSFAPQDNQAVLAATTGDSDLILNINIPSFFSQSVGIGTATQSASAILDLTSEDKGFLAPRMTTVQRNAIASPATGLFIYNTDTNQYNMYDGTVWKAVGGLTAVGDVATGDGFTETGTAGTALYFYDADGRGKLTTANLTGARTYTLPDSTGTVITTGNLTDITKVGTITSGVWDGTLITKLGTVGTGVWNGTAITVGYGGTGATTLTGILLGNGTSAVTGLTTSAGIRGAITDETGTGSMVFNTDPVFAGDVTPTTTLTSDLGSSSLYWNNVYAANFIGGTTGTSGYWQRNTNAISPTNISDDILVGATATSSALIKLTGTNVAGSNSSWFNAGNVGIGTTNPSSLFSVGSTSQFQVDSTGAISAVAGITSSGLLSFTGTDHAGLKINNLTTAQRDLLTPTAGMTIFNTSVTKMQVYNGSSWKNVGNPEIGAEVTSGTAGSVLYVDVSGNLGQDNSNFYWDASTHRLGIGTTNPSDLLSVGLTSQFQVSSTGAVTAVGVNSGAGLLQGALGLTVTGATASLNASSNFATNINTGTSTGAVTIGGTAGNTIDIGSDNSVADTITVGSALDSLALHSAHFDVTSAGAISGVTTLGLSGAITGATATNTINGAIINGSTQTFSANNIADSGALTIATGANGAFTLNPNGTGALIAALDSVGDINDFQLNRSGTLTSADASADILASRTVVTNSSGSLNDTANFVQFTSNISGTGTDTGSVLGLTQSAAGASGDVLAISNAGTGKDISGTSNTWNISKVGAITAATATNTINGLIINSGALSGVSTIDMSGILTNSSTGNALTLSGAGANLAFTGAGLAQITTATNQNLALMPGGTGSIGIGTTAPGAKLALVENITSGIILGTSYDQATVLDGTLTAAKFDLNDGHVTPTNQSVTGIQVVLPTTTNTNDVGTTVTYNGMSLGYGVGTGINQNGAGATVYNGANLLMPALTQTAGTLTANGVLVTTPASITTGGTANGINIAATGVGAGSLNGVYVSNITGSGGTETALNIGSGWDNILSVNGSQVVNGSGVVQVAAGGTGLTSYTAGDLIYASGTTTLTQLAGGVANNGKVLVVTAGVPTWGTMSGSSCTDCVLNDPTSNTSQTIAPTGNTTTGLIVKQTSTALEGNTPDIFTVTSSDGLTKYFYVDSTGNVSTGGVSSQTLTLTPLTNITALTLVGTNVSTVSLQDIQSKNTQGTIFNMAYEDAGGTALVGALIGQKINLATNVTATDQSATGISVVLPSVTNTTSASEYKGLTVSLPVGSGINQNGAGSTVFSGVDITIPPLTQTAGTLTANGALITTPTSITTGGTANGINIAAAGVGAGTLRGINISNITGGAGAETAIHTGTDWDYAAIFEGGYVGIGTTAPGAELEVAGQVKITGGIPGANKVLTSDAVGLASWSTLTGLGGVGGSGTTNYVTKWTPDGNNIGNSLIFDDGTGIGIGITAPGGMVEIDTSTTTGIALVIDQDDLDQTALDLDVNNTAGDIFNLDWGGSTSITGALIGMDLDFTNLNGDGVNALYGLHINDPGSATGSTEYGIFLEGANWDKALYSQDDIGLADSANLYLGTGNDLQLYHDGTNSYITNNTGDLYIGDAATDDVILQNNGGYVGIGTTAPAFLLHLANAGGSTETEIVQDNTSAAATNNAARFIQRALTDSMYRGIFEINSTFNTITDASRNSLVQFKTANAGTFGMAMTINGGYVGIGTTAPQSLLDVQAAAGAAGILTLATQELAVGDGDVLGQINFNAPLESSGSDAILAGASIWAEANATFDATHNTTDLVFATGASEAATEKMRIDSTGSVGIGITAPGYKLDVNGDINIAAGSNFKIDGANISPGSWVASGDDIYNSNIGNVGIGNTAPQSLLDVQGPAGVGAAAAGILTLATKETTVVDGDVLGKINFNAPLEADGSDAILAGASIWAEANATFDATHNTTDLVFATGASEAATEKMRIDSAGYVGIGTTAPTLALLQVEKAGVIQAMFGETDQSPNIYIANQMINASYGYDGDDGALGLNYAGYQNSTTRFRDLIIYDGKNTSIVYVDGSAGKVGIGITAPTQVLDVVGNIKTSGSIGFLDTAPSANVGIYALKNYTDPANSTAGAIYYGLPTYTGAESAAENFRGAYFGVRPIVNAGHTNSSFIEGIKAEALRNYNGVAADDDGTLTTLKGVQIEYGHFNSNTSADPQTTSAYGIYVYPYYMKGDITNMYDIYLGPASTGGVATNRWGIYQANTANNYFAGNVGIGTTTPTNLLSFDNALGIKINLYDNDSTSMMGFGVAAAEFQIGGFGSDASQHTSFGHWSGTTKTFVEQMRLTHDTGRVGIGITAPAYQLQLSTDSAGKPTSNTWTVVSDRRLKENITPFLDGLSIVEQLNPVNYTLNGKAGMPLGDKGISFIAQDVKDIIPYTVGTFKAKLNPEDTEETELYNFDSSALAFITINAIKEQQMQITSQGELLALQDDTLQNLQASSSAQISFTLADDPLFQESQDKITNLQSKFDMLSQQVEQQASTSAFLTEIVNSQVLGASTSASLALGDIEIQSATISADLMVLGRATVTDLGVTGNINAGLISIHGIDGEISTLGGDLYLQKDGLGGLNILDGKIVIDTQGNIKAAGTIAANSIEANNYTVLGDQSIGSATILTGETSVEISTPIASSSSKIFLIATSITDKQIAIAEKADGKFKVAILQPSTAPITFDWWIVGNK